MFDGILDMALSKDRNDVLNPLIVLLKLLDAEFIDAAATLSLAAPDSILFNCPKAEDILLPV
jgi:hypothetical protein